MAEDEKEIEGTEEFKVAMKVVLKRQMKNLV